MNLENCTEWKKSYKKPHSVWFRLHEMSRIDKSTGTEGGLVAARVWGRSWGVGRGKGTWLLMDRISFGLILHNLVNILKTEAYTLKECIYGIWIIPQRKCNLHLCKINTFDQSLTACELIVPEMNPLKEINFICSSKIWRLINISPFYFTFTNSFSSI